MAKLYFSYSTMNAGKSTLLLQAAHNYREQGMHTLTFTSALHQDLHDGRISSRLGISAPATTFGDGDDLFALIQASHGERRVDCVFVDEAQFLTRDQVWQLARVTDRLDIPVLCYGLRTDFRGELFPGSAVLLAIADSLREVRTICHCGRKATMVLRHDPSGAVTTSGDQIAVEKSLYVSLCRRHWEEATGRWPA
jgi:thymidine kinase